MMRDTRNFFGSAISTIVLVAVFSIVVIIAVGNTADLPHRQSSGNTDGKYKFSFNDHNHLTIPCQASLLNQTNSSTTTNENSYPDFGALFGNFCSMTVVLYGNDFTDSSITTLSFSVLGRGSYTSSNGNATDYELNLTTIAIEPDAQVVSSRNSTSAIVTPGNVTNRE